MASAILILGKLCFAAIGIAVGARLARDVRSRGEMGLHAVALAAICIGGIGLAAIPIGQSLGDTATGTGVALTGEWSMRAGMVLFCVFIWRTFRPEGLLWGRARRRLALGLADPAVVRRYLLWWSAMLSFVLICLLAMAAGEARDAGRNGLADAAQVTRGILFLGVTALAWLGVLSSGRETPASAATSSDAGS